LFDQTSGFWLIHSVPKFPPTDRYSYPDTARRYGQSFLCITFNYNQLKEIAHQLLYTMPWVYSHTLPTDIANDIPDLQLVVQLKSVHSPPYNRSITLTSAGGISYTHFGKHRNWGKDLYYEFVAPTLQQTLYTETWQNGPGDFPSSCDREFQVHNIQSIQLPENVNFPNSDDHSKWAAAENSAGPWICIGDINRQHGQLVRGGGTMCLKNAEVWKRYRNSVSEVQPCGPQNEGLSANQI